MLLLKAAGKFISASGQFLIQKGYVPCWIGRSSKLNFHTSEEKVALVQGSCIIFFFFAFVAKYTEILIISHSVLSVQILADSKSTLFHQPKKFHVEIVVYISWARNLLCTNKISHRTSVARRPSWRRRRRRRPPRLRAPPPWPTPPGTRCRRRAREGQTGGKRRSGKKWKKWILRPGRRKRGSGELKRGSRWCC